jgi:outer membrane protein assembly factor BamB
VATPSRPVGARRVAGALALALLGLLLPNAASATARHALLVVGPDHAPPTASVVVIGTGFGRDEEILVTFDAIPVDATRADGSGSFAIVVRVPRSARPGDHRISATGRSSDAFATHGFLVRVDWKDLQFDDANSGSNPYENVLDPTNVSGLRVAWRDWLRGWSGSSPVLADGIVYVGSNNHRLSAFDADTGRRPWSFPTNGRILSTPAVAKGIVYVGSSDGNVYALDAATGSKRWSHRTNGQVLSSPAVAGGELYVGSEDGDLYALDASTGTTRWTFPTGYPMESSPAVANGTVFVGSEDRRIYALDASTGKERWSFQAAAGSDGNPAVVDGVVYIGAGHFYALDAATGRMLWAFRGDGYGYLAGSAVANGVVYAASVSGTLHALDAATGKERWSFWMNASGASSPAVANGVVYVGGNGGVYALDASTGALLWDHLAGSTIATGPAVANGTVYVGSLDRHLYAFDLP